MALAAQKPDEDNKEFKTALELVRDTNISFFLTGKAGTGKSTFLRYVVENVPKNFVVVAPTGVAAVNVGGSTIHSFFKLPFQFVLQDISRFPKDSVQRKVLAGLDTLIIDEISMVRADILDAIDESMRLNCGNSMLPFGGKQVIFVGDVFQLQHVFRKDADDADFLLDHYDGKPLYFFNARVFEKFKLTTIELRKAYRQQEGDFLGILDRIRVRETTAEDLDALNSRVVSGTDWRDKKLSIHLCTTNTIVETENREQLQRLTSPEFIYQAEVVDVFEKEKFPAEKELRLKVGAQVMLIKNDSGGKWVNGTLARIVGLSDDGVQIKTRDEKTHKVPAVKWENIRYQYNRFNGKIEKEVIGSFTQYPLKLAWAITIHKSQGMTFEELILDLGNGAFASGQTYVALSRCTSMNGLYLKNKIQRKDIIVEDDVKTFAGSFNNFDQIESLTKEDADLRFFKENDLNEYMGQYHLHKCFALIQTKNFRQAYEHLIKGYELLTCDDFLQGQISEELAEKLFVNKQNHIPGTHYMEIMKVFVYFFAGKWDEAYELCLKYLSVFPKSELAYYFSGRINLNINRLKQAQQDFEKACQIKAHPRNLYYSALVLKEFGIKYAEPLLKSYVKNPSSMEVYSELVDYTKKRKRAMKLGNNTALNKILFNKEAVSKLLQEARTQDKHTLLKGKTVSTKEVLDYLKETFEMNEVVLLG